ncbi:uncharacterized protein ACHE_80762A [Aspergillus chevalieri]|uniref:Uncharacterized protein n=1 Tax=Aspergillus chevalieri TaxID=182096 RepID=A0A7R7VY14_ASPCH|nr:uncharacterized protein ACHE_80762A [Aspergillus chevalieri]BCR92862.1 hypothetical protein ACHE_80762A [Aspergillus chevalieri]
MPDLATLYQKAETGDVKSLYNYCRYYIDHLSVTIEPSTEVFVRSDNTFIMRDQSTRTLLCGEVSETEDLETMKEKLSRALFKEIGAREEACTAFAFAATMVGGLKGAFLEVVRYPDGGVWIGVEGPLELKGQDFGVQDALKQVLERCSFREE